MEIFKMPAEPGPDVIRIHPIGDPDEAYIRPEDDQNGEWYLEVDFAEGDQYDRWSGLSWRELWAEKIGEYLDFEGFVEAEKTPKELAVAFFRENPELSGRPSKVARDHAQALIAAALAA